MAVNLSMHVKELKERILSSQLPDNFIPRSEIDHIRLLNAGRELDDSKSVSEAHIQLPGGSVIPVHVVTVLKSSLSANQRNGRERADMNKDRPPSCWCIIC